MALGGITLTIKVNGVDKVLKRINQDNYATRYHLHEATQEFTANVRHNREKRNGIQYDVHNVELIQEVFATITTPSYVRTVWTTIRNTKNDDWAAIGYMAVALADLTKVAGNVDDLLSWVG